MATRTEKMTNHLLCPRPYPGKISLVMPMYNEEAIVPVLRAELERFIASLACEVEIVLVNDGS